MYEYMNSLNNDGGHNGSDNMPGIVSQPVNTQDAIYELTLMTARSL